MKTATSKLALIAVMSLGLAGCAGSARAYRAPYPPPPPGYGMRGAPGPGYIWVDSYRDWRRDRWVAVPGGWMMPPHPRARWTPGYFRGHGRSRVWVGAHWR